MIALRKNIIEKIVTVLNTKAGELKGGELMRFTSKIKNIINLLRTEKQVPIPQPVNVQKLLEGKVALITGGSGGIGFAIAEAFLKSGAKVIIAGTKEEKLKNCCEKLRNSIEKTGGTEIYLQYIVLNVLDVKSMPDKVRVAAALFPENKIDILVNSAGLNGKLNFEHMIEAEYDAIMDVNAKGTYFMSQAVSQFMIKKNIKGHILNVASSSALRPASTPYCMSKWAIKGLTVGLADVLLPHGIVVNAIAPGPVATPMLGKNEGDSIDYPGIVSGRYAMPSEIANLAVFMASDMGDMIVGDTFFITGGSGIISLHR